MQIHRYPHWPSSSQSVRDAKIYKYIKTDMSLYLFLHNLWEQQKNLIIIIRYLSTWTNIILMKTMYIFVRIYNIYKINCYFAVHKNNNMTNTQNDLRPFDDKKGRPKTATTTMSQICECISTQDIEYIYYMIYSLAIVLHCTNRHRVHVHEKNMANHGKFRWWYRHRLGWLMLLISCWNRHFFYVFHE